MARAARPQRDAVHEQWLNAVLTKLNVATFVTSQATVVAANGNVESIMGVSVAQLQSPSRDWAAGHTAQETQRLLDWVQRPPEPTCTPQALHVAKRDASGGTLGLTGGFVAPGHSVMGIVVEDHDRVFAGAAWDVSDQTRVADLLAATNERFDQIFNTPLPTAVVRWDDATYLVEACNEALRALVGAGLTGQQFAALHWEPVQGEPDPPAVDSQRVADSLHGSVTPPPMQAGLAHIRANSGMVEVRGFIQPVASALDGVLRWIVQFVDVGPERRVEQASAVASEIASRLTTGGLNELDEAITYSLILLASIPGMHPVALARHHESGLTQLWVDPHWQPCSASCPIDPQVHWHVSSPTEASCSTPLRLRDGLDITLLVHQPVVDSLSPVSAYLLSALATIGAALSRADATRQVHLNVAHAQTTQRGSASFVAQLRGGAARPLREAITYAQQLADEVSRSASATLSGDVAHIHSAIRHLSGLLTDLRSPVISQLSHPTVTVCLLDVDDVIRDAIHILQPTANERGITVSYLSQPHRVRADPQRLRQVMVNIVSNAIKYNVDNASVDVALRSGCGLAGDPDWVEIDVTDTGPGIAAQVRNRLFTMYDRLGAEQGPVPGSGVGLALSHTLVEAMGGWLWVDTGPAGVGTTVTLHLEGPASSLEVTTDRRCVVHVEDDDATRALVTRLLPSELGWDVVGATTLRSAYQVLTDEPNVGLIILDLRLPDGFSDELLHSLASGPHRDTPVIVLSGESAETLDSYLGAARVSVVLRKPVSLKDLRCALEGVTS